MSNDAVFEAEDWYFPVSVLLLPILLVLQLAGWLTLLAVDFLPLLQSITLIFHEGHHWDDLFIVWELRSGPSTGQLYGPAVVLLLPKCSIFKHLFWLIEFVPTTPLIFSMLTLLFLSFWVLTVFFLPTIEQMLPDICFIIEPKMFLSYQSKIVHHLVAVATDCFHLQFAHAIL